MSDREIKVTDRRIFTPEGELREGYEHLGAGDRAEPAAAEGQSEAERQPPRPESAVKEAESPPVPPGSGAEPTEAAAEPGPHAAGDRSRVEIPGTPEGLGAPTFHDLVSVLAEPALVYLGDARMPDGSTNENLDMARLYIDLLDLLRQRTAGRLSPEEATFLEELLYQLRMRYVQKSG